MASTLYVSVSAGIHCYSRSLKKSTTVTVTPNSIKMSSTESRSVREERQTDEVTREPQRSRKSGIFQLGRSNISVCGVRSVKADTVPKSKNCCLGRGRTKERPTLVSRSKSADQPRLSENFRLSKDASNRSLQDGTSIEPHVCGRRYMRKLSDGDGNGAK